MHVTLKRSDLVLNRSIDAFNRAWSYPVLGRFQNRILLVAVILLMCGARAYCGLIDSRAVSHDVFMLFDGAWRMLNGQHPHADFYSHVGFLSYLPTLIGLKLSGGTAWGFGYGQSLVGTVFAGWAFLIGRRRLADMPLVLFCLTATLTAIAPFAIGTFVLRPSGAMTYNRFGYVLLALLLPEAAAEPTKGRSKNEFWSGVSTGIILATCFFLKISYFAAALFLLTTLLPCRPQRKRRWLGITAGLACTTFVCGAYFHFDLRPYLHDLSTVAGSKQIHFRSYLLDQVLQDAGLAVAFSIGVALLFLRDENAIKARSAILLGIVVSLAGVGVLLGNAQLSGLPLTAFLAILLISELISYAKNSLHSDFFRFTVLLLGSTFLAGTLVADSLGLATAVVGRIHIYRRLPPMHSAALSGFIPTADDFSYGVSVNDGLDLVNKYRRPGDSIMSLDFSNPFSYALSMRPAPGGTTVLQYETTFSDRFCPSAAYLFGSASLTAVPLTFSDGSLASSIWRIYGPYLRSHFHLVGSSSYWRLYRRDN